nr:MAG TPA: hypothetical protein [Caudoviricetes sp.]
MNKGYKPKEIHTIKALENNRRSLLDLIEEKRSQLSNIPRIYLSKHTCGYERSMSYEEYFNYYIPVELLCFNYTPLYKRIDKAIRSNQVGYSRL